jgi:hypothetical protein
MQNKTEQMAVPSEFRLFRGREKPQNSVPNHFSKEKTSEFRSKPFLSRENPSEFHSEPFHGREKPTEFRSELFLDEKNLGIPFRIIFGKKKRKKPRNYVLSPFLKRKNFGILFRINF